MVAQTCSQIGPAVIKGKKFFDSNSGKYIPIKGIAYYPRPNEGEDSTGGNRDFFSEEYRVVWERDIEQFQSLGINTVRIYAVNPGLDHSGFMCALKERGMYVIVDITASCEGCAVAHYDAPDCYPAELKTRGQFVINIFSKYENVLAFSAGNEAQLFTPGEPPENNGVCQKQFMRDMRAYIQSCPTIRQIPVGVIVADVDRDLNALYYNCRSDAADELENAEWYGLNVYLHCDGTAQSIADLEGYNQLLADHQQYQIAVPVVIAEFGCPGSNFPTIDGFPAQRDFLDVEAIFTSDFVEYFNGAVAFEYSVEKYVVNQTTDVPFPYSEGYVRNRFGIGYYLPEDCDDVSTSCSYTPYPEFDILALKYAAVDTSFVPSFDDYTPVERDVTDCPDQFPPLSSYTWPSAGVEDLECPGSDYTFICSGTPTECLPPFASPAGNTTQPSPSSTIDTPTTSTPAPTGPTLFPSVAGDENMAPVAGPATSTDAPTLAMPTMDYTPAPSSTPLEFVPATLAPDSSAFYSSASLWLCTCVLLCLVWA